MSTEILSDKNVLLSKSVMVAKTRRYADFDLSLTLHPDFKDITPLVDVDAVKSSVKNLILTNSFERPFQHEIGAGVSSLLFENNNRFTSFLLKQAITDTLSKYEPRVDSVQVSVTDNSDENRYDVTITFRVIALDQSVEVFIKLERVR